MNTDLTTAAVERLTAQLGEALFNQPGLDLIEIANRCNKMVARTGSALLPETPVIGRLLTVDEFKAPSAPFKPEAVRLRDELRERAAFEAWANGRDLTRTRADEYVSCWVQNDWETWQAALAATGKQQVGQESAGQPEKCRSGAELQAEQDGEVQGGSILRAACAPPRRFDPVAAEAALSTAAALSPTTPPYWTQAHAEALNEAVHTSLSVYAVAFSQKKRDAISGHIRNLLVDKAVQS